MNRLSHTDLAAAHGRQQWAVLWQHAIPLVKLTVGRMARGNKQAAPDVYEDMVQEGYVVAGVALREWDPFECAFSTHIMNSVRWQLISHLGETRNHGIGSRAQKPVVLNMGDSRDGMFGFGSDEYAEEDEDDGTFDAALTYDGVLRPSGQYDGYGSAPEGLGNPADEADRITAEAALCNALDEMSPARKEMACALYGIGRAVEHLDAFARRKGFTGRTVYRRRRELLEYLAKKLPNFYHNKYGSKENVRDTQ